MSRKWTPERRARQGGIRRARNALIAQNPVTQAAPAQSEFMRRFQMVSVLIAHHTESMKTYAEWVNRERENLVKATRMLEELLSEVEAVANDPFPTKANGD